MVSTSTQNNLSYLIEKTLITAENKEKARKKLYKEMTKFIDSQNASGSSKRLMSLINCRYTIKLTEVYAFMRFFQLDRIEDLLPIHLDEDFRTAREVLEPREVLA